MPEGSGISFVRAAMRERETMLVAGEGNALYVLAAGSAAYCLWAGAKGLVGAYPHTDRVR